jgi:hypothetical protein
MPPGHELPFIPDIGFSRYAGYHVDTWLHALEPSVVN